MKEEEKNQIVQYSIGGKDTGRSERKEGSRWERRHGAGKIKKENQVHSGIGLDPGEKERRLIQIRKERRSIKVATGEGSSKGTGENKDPVNSMREEGFS